MLKIKTLINKQEKCANIDLNTDLYTLEMYEGIVKMK